MPSLRVYLFSAAFSLTCFPCFGENSTAVNVTSRTETYAYASDTLNAVVLNPVLFGGAGEFIKLGVGALESLATGCAQFDIWGFNMTTDEGDLSFNFESTLSSTVGVSNSLGQGGVAVNNVKQTFKPTLIPSITPCGPTDVHTKMGGSASLYIVHAGTSAYQRRTNSGDFRVCRSIEIQNGSDEKIELPVHINGSATTGVSLAPDATTFARAELEISGQVGGSSFSEAIVASNGLPDNKSINITKNFVVADPRSERTFSYDVTGKFKVDVSAKGIGFFGLITQSASAGVDFPNTIEIRSFTGENGGPLPPNVVIRVSGDSGVVLADTSMSLSVVEVDEEVVKLRANGAISHEYRIQYSSDLKTWSDVGERFELKRQAQTVTVGRVGSRGYYRLAHR